MNATIERNLEIQNTQQPAAQLSAEERRLVNRINSSLSKHQPKSSGLLRRLLTTPFILY